ncbi:MAG: DUF547 domain-containing protein [Neomegalonema sp.]|nr:DUF547 domain-containing protein [Neomegalonema sp.]
MKRPALRLLLAVVFCSVQAIGQAFADEARYHDDLDGLLAEHVRPATARGISYHGVDYDAWALDPRHARAREALLATDPARLPTRSDRLAFWINAYNLLTIDLIVREGERETIKNLGGLFSTPWQRHKWTIAGAPYSLDDIEHKIIRPMGEPRIHFAINCAAISCPDLRRESYRGERLEEQLADQTRRLLENGSKGLRRGREADGGDWIMLSRVMRWFDEDFDNGDLRGWLAPYLPGALSQATDVRFFDYDWSLNKR